MPMARRPTRPPRFRDYPRRPCRDPMSTIKLPVGVIRICRNCPGGLARLRVSRANSFVSDLFRLLMTRSLVVAVLHQQNAVRVDRPCCANAGALRAVVVPDYLLSAVISLAPNWRENR